MIDLIRSVSYRIRLLENVIDPGHISVRIRIRGLLTARSSNYTKDQASETRPRNSLQQNVIAIDRCLENRHQSGESLACYCITWGLDCFRAYTRTA